MIGRKAKFNLARGAILKIRQLEINYAVEKGKYVLLTSRNENVRDSRRDSFEQGQIGDIIKVKMSVRENFNVVVTSEKKASPPLTCNLLKSYIVSKGDFTWLTQ